MCRDAFRARTSGRGGGAEEVGEPLMERVEGLALHVFEPVEVAEHRRDRDAGALGNGIDRQRNLAIHDQREDGFDDRRSASFTSGSTSIDRCSFFSNRSHDGMVDGEPRQLRVGLSILERWASRRWRLAPGHGVPTAGRNVASTYHSDMPIELRNSDRLPAPQGFSHASIAPPGRIVHLAGQIGTDADGNHPDGLAAQTEQALNNVIDAVVGIGAATNDVAKLTMYVVGWRAAMQRELFAGLAASAAAQESPLPLVPITLVGVQSLFLDESLIEIEAVAVLSD